MLFLGKLRNLCQATFFMFTFSRDVTPHNTPTQSLAKSCEIPLSAVDCGGQGGEMGQFQGISRPSVALSDWPGFHGIVFAWRRY
jgi:hypothetical protein